MPITRTRLLATLIVGLAAIASPAVQAFPITTIAAGDTVIFNFDFSGSTPPPPYVGGFTRFITYTRTGAPVASFEFRGGLNGAGPLIEFYDNVVIPASNLDLGPVASNPNYDTYLDGNYSVVVKGLVSTFDFALVFGYAGITSLDQVRIEATIGSPVAVPEPGTLALLCLGFASLTMSRRRKV
jgi:hypothetical protein